MLSVDKPKYLALHAYWGSTRCRCSPVTQAGAGILQLACCQQTHGVLAAGVVGQQALLPQHSDPKLWLVHTKPGAEREAVQCLLQKGVDLALRGVPLQIKAAFTQDHLKARPGWRSLSFLVACTHLQCESARMQRASGVST